MSFTSFFLFQSVNCFAVFVFFLISNSRLCVYIYIYIYICAQEVRFHLVLLVDREEEKQTNFWMNEGMPKPASKKNRRTVDGDYTGKINGENEGALCKKTYGEWWQALRGQIFIIVTTNTITKNSKNKQ